jgi:hypothetical protein
MFVERPLGAFHQVADSFVRQAAQLALPFVGCMIMEPSSSEAMPAISSFLTTSPAFKCWFSSRSLELKIRWVKKGGFGPFNNLLLPVAIVADYLRHGSHPNFVTNGTKFGTVHVDRILKRYTFVFGPVLVHPPRLRLLPLFL